MIYLAIVCTVLVLDQVLKHLISDLLPLCEPGICRSIELLPMFKLTVLHNSGAAFSILNDAGGWQRWFLVSVSAIASVVITVWLSRVYREQRLLAFALALILGGALGNLVDRMIQGYVVDFFVFYYESYYFPAFNIADAAISIGGAMLILDMIVGSRTREELRG